MPDQTDQLRNRIAAALTREDVNWGYHCGFEAGTGSDMTAAYVHAVLATVQPELDRLRQQLWEVHDICDQIDLELSGTIPPDDTAYGGLVTRVRNAAGFRPTRTVQES